MSQAELEQLLQQVALRNRAAFKTLYQRTSAKLFGICLRILMDRAAAEEALQETYAKIWRNAEQYSRARASPIAWLAAIARNQSIDMLRARKPRADDIDTATQIADDRPGPEANTIAADEGRRLQACIGELPARQAKAIRAAYFGGHTYNALAKRAGVPLGTMKSWIRRGLIKLRDCMNR